MLIVTHIFRYSAYTYPGGLEPFHRFVFGTFPEEWYLTENGSVAREERHQKYREHFFSVLFCSSRRKNRSYTGLCLRWSVSCISLSESETKLARPLGQVNGPKITKRTG